MKRNYPHLIRPIRPTLALVAFSIFAITVCLLPSKARAATSITLTSPSNGASISNGNLTVSGTSTSNTSVIIYADDVVAGWVVSDGSGNWSKSLTGLVNGTHTITAKAVQNGTYAYFAGAGEDDTINRMRLSDESINPGGGAWPVVTALTWLLPSPSQFTSAGFGYFLQPGNPGLIPGKFDVNNPAEPAAITNYQVNPNALNGTFNSDGSKWYGVNPDTNNVSVVDVASNTQIDSISVGTGPSSVSLEDDGHLLVGNAGDDTVTVINTANNSVEHTWNTDCTTPGALTVIALKGYASDSDSFYVSCSEDAIIKHIQTDTGTILGTIDLSSQLQPIGNIITTPDFHKMYVSGRYGSASSDKIAVVDLTTDSFVKTITLSGASFGPSMSPDGQQLYAGVQGSFDLQLIDVIPTSSDDVDHTIDIAPRGTPGLVAFDAPNTAQATATITIGEALPSVLPKVGPAISLVAAILALVSAGLIYSWHKRSNDLSA